MNGIKVLNSSPKPASKTKITGSTHDISSPVILPLTCPGTAQLLECVPCGSAPGEAPEALSHYQFGKHWSQWQLNFRLVFLGLCHVCSISLLLVDRVGVAGVGTCSVWVLGKVS